jgi:hypothetical protein
VQHVVIRQESYVAGTRERPEVGIFTQTRTSRPPGPWGKLGVGDLVWMKWSGEPISAYSANSPRDTDGEWGVSMRAVDPRRYGAVLDSC